MHDVTPSPAASQPPSPGDMTTTARQQLAPDGVLRVALNLSNSLLVSGKDADGGWRGVAPDMAAAIATELGAALELVGYATPGEVADAADTGAWAVAMIGADPARAAKIVFVEPYVEIEVGYLVPPGSALTAIGEVDRPGLRIAAYEGSAYDLWLRSHLRHATLVHGKTFDAAFERFRNEGLDALASLMPKLEADQRRWPGSRMLPGCVMAVQQSLGTARGNREAAVFLGQFVRRAKQSGWLAGLISEHGVSGLTVSPPGDAPA